MTDRQCRECGIAEIGPEVIEIDGRVLCWVDDDLCSICQDRLHEELVRDAARYRYLRDRPTRAADIAAGGVFAGCVPDNMILGGEDLDRAIDSELGADIPQEEPLERRLADCLADIIDTPLMTGPDRDGGKLQVDLHLNFFRPDLSERAAELLEEAGL